MTWKQVPAPDYIETTDITLTQRFYTFGDEPYPLLQIGISSAETNYGPLVVDPNMVPGMHIGASYQRTSESWWEERLVCIPLQLMGDLRDMITEAEEVLRKRPRPAPKSERG